jgi:peptide/nickel transport system permease protein
MTDLLEKRDTDAAPALSTQVASPPRKKRRLAPSVIVAGVFVAVLLVAVALPQLFTTVDPFATVPADGLKAPGAEHWFGTDRLGRDIFSRVIHGARYSILIGLSATAIAVVAGSLAGLSGRLIPGRLGLVVDETFGRLFDVISSFPGVLLAMVVVTFAGPGVQNIAVAIGIASIPMYGRVVRSQTLLVTRADFVTHAAVYGRSRARVVIEHVLPNVLVAIPVLAAIDVGASILAVSGLSFLGLGPQAPIPEWGVMLAESRDVLRIAWWGGFFPGLFITASVIALTVLGRALQRHIDGRNR